MRGISIKAMMRSKDSVEFYEYIQGEDFSEYYLDIIMKSNLYKNTNTKEILGVDLVEQTGSQLIIPLLENDPIGIIGILLQEEGGFKYAKWPYRMAFNRNMPFRFFGKFQHLMDEYFFQWMREREVLHYGGFINEDNPKMLEVCLNNHTQKMKRSGEYYVKQAKVYNKMVFEKETWSYVLFVSPDQEWFLDREEKEWGEDCIHLKGKYDWFIK